VTEANGLLSCTFGLRFWGTRGSIPVSGASHVRYGGDTICFEIMIDGRRLIVDAGSGLRRLGDALAKSGEGDASLLFSHFHLDHVIGLTSFTPLLGMAGRVSMLMPDFLGDHPREHLESLFRKPFFPLELDRLPCRLAIGTFTPGHALIHEGLDISTTLLHHGGGATGYRFRHAGQTLVILTDHEHARDEPDGELVAFCAGADLLVYDAMWDETEDYDRHRGWGHSTWQAGLRLLTASGARRMACVHHAPSMSDQKLDEREKRLRQAQAESFFARQDDLVVLIA
jgi:phosphoribosyl 1,2-cyclic phosphodiesterase